MYYKRWSLYSELRDLRQFDILSKKRQAELITDLLQRETAKCYYIDNAVFLLIDKVDNKTFMDITTNYLTNGRQSSLNGKLFGEVISKAISIDRDKTKEIIKNSKIKKLARSILMFKNLTEDEEENGLRSLSTSTKAPSILHDTKYCPRLEVLNKLPPITRLKTLEALVNNKYIKYNIFKNIKEDEFKALLFTSHLKYTDRVEQLCNKYSEYANMGIKAEVQISGFCDQCEDFNVKITSNVMRTVTGLQNTWLKALMRESCPFCRRHLKQKPSFVEL